MIGELLALVGAILVLLSAIGVVRFGDVLARLHALAKASTLGVLLILAGAAVNLRDLNDLTSVVLAGILHLLASPPASNMVSRAAYLAEGLPADALDERGKRGSSPPGPMTNAALSASAWTRKSAPARAGRGLSHRIFGARSVADSRLSAPRRVIMVGRRPPGTGRPLPARRS